MLITPMPFTRLPLTRVLATALTVLLLGVTFVVFAAVPANASCHEEKEDANGDPLTEDACKVDEVFDQPEIKEDIGGTDANIVKDSQSFFNTGVGTLLVQVARVMAIVLGIWAILKFGAAFFSRNQAGGGLGRALGPAVMAFVAAGLLMNIGWTAALLSWFTDIIGRVFQSIADLFF